MTATELTVIVPVYRGIEDARACIESVRRHGGERPYELLVIDDCSPEPQLVAYLEGLADDVTVLHNPENLGFVATVNRGLERVTGHAVILNADTVVTEGWLDRLTEAVDDEADVGTVTPLTNFGSICTLPSPVIEAFGLDTTNPRIDACADFVRTRGLGRRPDVITGVGFCMLITRDALDACGDLDVDTFGRGYGEEVDFCLRATRLGFRHLVEDRTFVYHRGGGSFGTERAAGLERGSMLIRDRYPWFRPTLRRERKNDPLAVSFAALELGLHERDARRPQVLHLLHSAPDALGGSEKHLAALIDSLAPDFDFAVLYPVRSGYALRTYWQGEGGERVEHEFLLPGGPLRTTRVSDENAAGALRTALDMFDFDAIHIQNLIGHSLAPLAVVESFAGKVVCSVRDPFLICPNHTLLYRGREFCGVPEDLSFCATCLPETRQEDLHFLERFRATVTKDLDRVDTWVFASQSAADLFSRAYAIDPGRTKIIAHGSIVDVKQRRTQPDEALLYDEPLRVAFVGLGRAKKGLDTVNWLALQPEAANIEIHHFGTLLDLADRVHLHGAYDNTLLPALLDEAGVHVVLLPGLVSETFGHVVTEAWVAGRPVIGAFYGALGERIRQSGAGWTIDPMDHDQILRLLVDLDRCRAELVRATRAAMSTPLRTVTDTASEYAAVYSRRHDA